MRGISEERLIELCLKTKRFDDITLINHLVKHECVELNDWKPIDENTPKDRNFLGFVPGAYGLEIIWWEPRNDRWSCHPYVMSHWQELPPPPK